MSEKTTSSEIQVLILPEGEAPSGFRGEPARGWPDVLGRLRPTKIKLDELACNVRLFTQQMEGILADTPPKLGEFEFAEFEVSAAINAEGKLSICGFAGAQAGVEGGLKFVFKKHA